MNSRARSNRAPGATRPKTDKPRSPQSKVDRSSAGQPALTKDFAPLIAWHPVSDLKPYPRNPRTHSKAQIRQIAASIEEFGFTNPILVVSDGGIIAGHGRLEAAKLLGLNRVPVIQLDHLSEAQKRAYVIADNRLAEKAGWDQELLVLELQGLLEFDLDFDVEITGFETAEIDLLIEGLADQGEEDQADVLPEIDPNKPPVSQPGDLWLLGSHRLLCGNALEAESYVRLMDGAQAQMVFIDPPYNVKIDGNVCGSGRIKHREFAMASGEMSETEFTTFLEKVFGHLASHSTNGAIHFIFMDWRHFHELLTAAREIYAGLKNLCVWAKTNGGMGSLYRSQHELVAVFKNGTAPHINNIELGRHGRNRTNVWTYPGVNSLSPERMTELALHPTVKPVALIADAILDCSKRGGIVLDAFAGSGTTLIAAEKTGRRGYGIELDPVYIDVAIERFQKLTGTDATHVETGMTFAEVKSQRLDTKETADVR